MVYLKILSKATLQFVVFVCLIFCKVKSLYIFTLSLSFSLSKIHTPSLILFSFSLFFSLSLFTLIIRIKGHGVFFSFLLIYKYYKNQRLNIIFHVESYHLRGVGKSPSGVRLVKSGPGIVLFSEIYNFYSPLLLIQYFKCNK